MKETFKVVAKKLPEGLVVESNARGFKLLFDEPESLGGTNVALNPIEALISAFGACQSIVVAAFAPSFDIEYEEFHVELEGDIDLDGFMGITDVRKGLSEIRFKMHFKSNASQEKLEEFADFVEETCPVADCLANPVKLVRTAVVRD